MTEEILLANESGVAVEVRVELECAADFGDIFEIRGHRRSAERGRFWRKLGTVTCASPTRGRGSGGGPWCGSRGRI